MAWTQQKSSDSGTICHTMRYLHWWSVCCLFATHSHNRRSIEDKIRKWLDFVLMVNHTTDKITNLTTYDLKFCFREVCCCCLLESRACSRCVFVVGTNMQLEMRPRGLGVTNLALTNTMLSSEKNMITEAHNHTVRARSALHDLDQATGRSSFKNKFALSFFPQIRESRYVRFFS